MKKTEGKIVRNVSKNPYLTNIDNDLQTTGLNLLTNMQLLDTLAEQDFGIVVQGKIHW